MTAKRGSLLDFNFDWAFGSPGNIPANKSECGGPKPFGEVVCHLCGYVERYVTWMALSPFERLRPHGGYLWLIIVSISRKLAVIS